MKLAMSEKYHLLWYLQVSDKAAPFLHPLKIMPVDQIRTQARISRFDEKTNPFILNWEGFVGNEHTRPFIEHPTEKLVAIHNVLQPISVLLFPQWTMDRFKEALDQYSRGEWLSSISLCGDIVEFIVNEFWAAYNEKIPREMRKTPSESTIRNLKLLLNLNVIDDEDYCRLSFARDKRDSHVHNYPREKFLTQDYPKVLARDNLEVVAKLSEFFARDNMESKYKIYLEYAATLG